MDVLQSASGRLFFALGSTVLLSLFIVQSGLFLPFFDTILALLDLPLLFAGCVFAGSSFLSTIAHPASLKTHIILWSLLGTFFLGCVICNFAFPFQVYGGF